MDDVERETREREREREREQRNGRKVLGPLLNGVWQKVDRENMFLITLFFYVEQFYCHLIL
jgi:hypothetical protein